MMGSTVRFCEPAPFNQDLACALLRLSSASVRARAHCLDSARGGCLLLFWCIYFSAARLPSRWHGRKVSGLPIDGDRTTRLHLNNSPKERELIMKTLLLAIPLAVALMFAGGQALAQECGGESQPECSYCGDGVLDTGEQCDDG